MNLQGDKIGHWVRTATEKADKFIIVSPFFSVNTEIRNWLKGIPDLQILIGDEFSINNPNTLKELSEFNSTDIRCIYRDQFKKRLHAKIFYATDASGRCQALVGSANFTVNGLMKNKEQAVSFDSKNEMDKPLLDRILQWIVELQKSALCVDWERAEAEYQRSFELNRRVSYFDAIPEARNYWILKTTAGSQGKCFWDRFVQEGKIAIGWEGIIADMNKKGFKPNQYSLDSLESSTRDCYEAENVGNRRSEKHAAKTILQFSKEFSKNDRVIICKGYKSKQYKDVRLHGLAIVNKRACDDSSSNWWRLKCSANIERMDIDIPKEVFSNTLKKDSLLKTIHKISKEDYERFMFRIREF